MVPSKFPWWVISLCVGGLAALLTWFAIFVTPNFEFVAILTVFVVISVVLVLWNPKYYYRRTASFVVGSWISITSASGLNISAKFEDDIFGFLLDSVGWAFHFVVAVVVVFLYLLDYWTNHANQKSGIHQNDSTEFHENIEILDRVPKGKRTLIATLLINAIHGRGVPLDNLTREQKTDLRKSEIRLKRFHYLCQTGIAVVLIVASGIVASGFSINNASLNHKIDLIENLSNECSAKILEIDINRGFVKENWNEFSDRQFEKYATKLKNQLSTFEEIYSGLPLSNDEKLTLAIAESTYYIAAGEFDKVVAAVPDQVREFANTKASTGDEYDTQRACSIYWNRGIAYAKTDQGAKARDQFKHVYRLQPKNFKALGNAAVCHWKLGEFVKAHSLSVQVTEHYREQVHSFGRTDLTDEWAWSLSILADSLTGLGQVEDAIEKYSDSISAYERLQYPNQSLRLEKAVAFNNRGIANSTIGKFNDAASDFGKAVESYREVGGPYASKELAVSLSNRGSAYLEMYFRTREYEENAFADIDTAIRDLSQFVSNGCTRLNIELAKAYNNRGNYYRMQFFFKKDVLDFKNGVSDYNEAIRLVATSIVGNDSERDKMLAKFYMNKGVLLFENNELERSLAVYAKAIRVYQHLLAEGNVELHHPLALSFFNRARALIANGQDEHALNDFEQAISNCRKIGGSRRFLWIHEVSGSLSKRCCLVDGYYKLN